MPITYRYYSFNLYIVGENDGGRRFRVKNDDDENDELESHQKACGCPSVSIR